MQKTLLNILLLLLVTTAWSQKSSTNTGLSETLDAWHSAAASANFKAYFDLMTDDAVFIGTDATENWNRSEFMRYAKPHFDKGKAWSFTSIERNVYEADDLIYFDELLDTQMGICRGSGVLKKEAGSWKIAHYVLSIAVPNQNVKELTALKKEWDSNFILERKKQF